MRDGACRSRFVHQFAEHRAEQEEWEVGGEIAPQRRHEDLRVARVQRQVAPVEKDRDGGADRGDEDHVPAAVREEDQKRERYEDADDAEHGVGLLLMNGGCIRTPRASTREQRSNRPRSQ
jgi:hypothetical protein